MAPLYSRPRKGELQLCGGSGKLHLLSRAAVRRMISFKQDFCGLRMVIAPLSSAIVESYFLFSSKPARRQAKAGQVLARSPLGQCPSEQY